MSTARRSAEWAGVTSGSRRTWPKTYSRLLRIRDAMFSLPVWLVTEVFVTKWNQRIPRIRRWQFIWNATSRRSSAFVRIQVSETYKRTEMTKEWKAASSCAYSILTASRCWSACWICSRPYRYVWVSLEWSARRSAYHCRDMWSDPWSLQHDPAVAQEPELPHGLSSGSWFSTRMCSGIAEAWENGWPLRGTISEQHGVILISEPGRAHCDTRGIRTSGENPVNGNTEKSWSQYTAMADSRSRPSLEWLR